MAYRWGFVDPWRELRQLQREMNTVFESAFGRPAEAAPPCNVLASENDFLITCEVPGVTLDGLDISVMGDVLTVKGERKPADEVQPEAYHRRERRTRPFNRSIQLPNRVDPENVEAEYEDGVLIVHLSKAAEEKPRKITVKSV